MMGVVGLIYRKIKLDTISTFLKKLPLLKVPAETASLA